MKANLLAMGDALGGDRAWKQSGEASVCHCRQDAISSPVGSEPSAMPQGGAANGQDTGTPCRRRTCKGKSGRSCSSLGRDRGEKENAYWRGQYCNLPHTHSCNGVLYFCGKGQTLAGTLQHCKRICGACLCEHASMHIPVSKCVCDDPHKGPIALPCTNCTSSFVSMLRSQPKPMPALPQQEHICSTLCNRQLEYAPKTPLCATGGLSLLKRLKKDRMHAPMCATWGFRYMAGSLCDLAPA